MPSFREIQSLLKRRPSCLAVAAVLGLTLASATGEARERVVRPNSWGGTDTYTRWTAKNTTFVHFTRTDSKGRASYQRFAHKKGDPGTVHWLTGSAQTTRKGKSWRMANGVLGERRSSTDKVSGISTSERTTHGKRRSTTRTKESDGESWRTRRWNLNSRQQVVHHDGDGKKGDHQRYINSSQVPATPRIRTLFDRASAMFDKK